MPESTPSFESLQLLAAGGHHAEALKWIRDNDRADAAGDRELLLGLAPELRTPVETVLARIDTFTANGCARVQLNAAFNRAWEAEQARIEAATPSN